MAAVFNINHHATYVHWHFIDLSLSNVLVIAVMLAVFVLAILLPFPHTKGVEPRPTTGQSVGGQP